MRKLAVQDLQVEGTGILCQTSQMPLLGNIELAIARVRYLLHLSLAQATKLLQEFRLT